MRLSVLLAAGAAAAALALPAFAADTAPQAAPAAAVDLNASVVRDGTDLPGPLAHRVPQVVHINITTKEVTARIADGATYKFWTFDGKVPGPFLRVRVGDTVEISVKNDPGSVMMHNIDLHAVTGPGGGGGATMVMPGEQKGFSFKALKPGLYVYHCASPMVSQHISNGMYGMILVEPEGGLPKVDHEFYVMQGEVYTDEPLGTKGELNASIDKLLNEQPEFYIMNGGFKALTGDHVMKVKTGETVRIFFGDGGPNKSSAFHVIGGIFDKLWPNGSVTDPPVTNVQTFQVAPGDAVMAELTFPVPGTYSIVDHALSRVERGGAAVIIAEGPPAPDIFKAPATARSDMTH